MTVNFLIVLIDLAATAWWVRAQGPTSLQRLAALVILSVSLPFLVWPDAVPLSHVLFETSSRALLTALATLASAVWAFNAWLWARRGRPPAAGVVLACTALWIALGAAVSDYESGPTPAVTDSPWWVIQAVTLYVVALASAVMLARPRRSSSTHSGQPTGA